MLACAIIAIGTNSIVWEATGMDGMWLTEIRHTGWPATYFFEEHCLGDSFNEFSYVRPPYELLHRHFLAGKLVANIGFIIGVMVLGTLVIQGCKRRQFSLRSLLIFTTAACIVAASLRVVMVT